jgi:hypothetical protein
MAVKAVPNTGTPLESAPELEPQDLRMGYAAAVAAKEARRMAFMVLGWCFGAGGERSGRSGGDPGQKKTHTPYLVVPLNAQHNLE